MFVSYSIIALLYYSIASYEYDAESRFGWVLVECIIDLGTLLDCVGYVGGYLGNIRCHLDNFSKVVKKSTTKIGKIGTSSHPDWQNIGKTHVGFVNLPNVEIDYLLNPPCVIIYWIRPTH